MSILTTPERLAKVLIDCHPSIVAAYHYTQGAIDEIERPCWLIFVEDASYPQIGTEQELVEQPYSIAFVGNVWNSADEEFSVEYEQLAREIAEASVLYLLEHPQLQMSNKRGIFESELTSLDGVHTIKLGRRSSVTLYSRDAVSGEAFWGFTIDITAIEQLAYCVTGLP
jgi:hypothetical protein